MYYGHPHKLPGTERTVEWNAFQCQQRCQVVDGCAHFSFWPHDGGCLLTGEESTLKAAPDGKPPKTGPKFCPSAVDAAQEAIAQVPDNDPSTGLPATDVVSSGIPQAESAWASSDSKDTSDVTAVVPPAGVNGTSCSKYPACVDVGITEGDCCPNAAAVTLGCCNGFPKAVEEVKIAKGSECSKFPACVALNISGGCCPTSTGLMLGDEDLTAGMISAWHSKALGVPTVQQEHSGSVVGQAEEGASPDDRLLPIFAGHDRLIHGLRKQSETSYCTRCTSSMPIRLPTDHSFGPNNFWITSCCKNHSARSCSPRFFATGKCRHLMRSVGGHRY
eukprot:g18036.t1